MENPKQYTVYKRIAPISIVGYWVLWMLFAIWFADITDRYPDLDTFLGVVLVAAIIWGPFFAGQFASRFKCVATVKSNAIVHIDAASRYALIRDYHPVIMLKDVNEISTGHGLFTGNYILLRFRYGHTMKLYSKRYMFTRNPEFFDLYVALKNAWNGIEATEKEKIRDAKEREGFVGAGPAFESMIASLPDMATPAPTPAATTATPIPHAAGSVRSAVRNSDAPDRKPEVDPKKADTGNGIVIAAVVFCAFLIIMAATISSYEVPTELEGVRDTLYTMLIVIALILGGIVVMSFVNKRRGG